jgi:methyl-accepting chemotaxis protein
MLARYSIRAKITIVVCFLLIAMSTMGGLAMKQMSDINDSTVEIANSWLPSVRVLGEIRAATITYRAIARSHLLANTEAAGSPSEEVDRQRREGPKTLRTHDQLGRGAHLL